MILRWSRPPNWRTAPVRRIDLREVAADIAANLGTTADVRVTRFRCKVRIGSVEKTDFNFDPPIRALIWALTLAAPFLGAAVFGVIRGALGLAAGLAVVCLGGVIVQWLNSQLNGAFNSRVKARMLLVQGNTFAFEEVAVHALLLLWAVRDTRPFGAGRLQPSQLNWLSAGNSVNASVGVPIRKALRELATNTGIATRARNGSTRIGWSENYLLDQPFGVATKYQDALQAAWKRPTAVPIWISQFTGGSVARAGLKIMVWLWIGGGVLDFLLPYLNAIILELN